MENIFPITGALVDILNLSLQFKYAVKNDIKNISKTNGTDPIRKRKNS